MLHARLSDIVLWGTIVGGLVVVSISSVVLTQSGAWAQLVPFVVLAVLADRLGVDLIESRHQRLSFSFSIAVMLLAAAVNPPLAPLVGLADGSAHSLRGSKRRLDKTLFNMTNAPLASAAASVVYLLLRPHLGGTGLGELAIGFLAVVAFFLTNTLGVSLMVSLKAGRPFLEVLGDSYWAVPINLLLGLTGAFVGSGFGQLGVIGTAMFVVPLGVLRVTLVIFSRKSRQAISALEKLNDQLSGEVVAAQRRGSRPGRKRGAAARGARQRRGRHPDRRRIRPYPDVQSGW